MRWKVWIAFLALFAAGCLLADWLAMSRIQQVPSSDIVRIQHLYQTNEGEIPMFGTSKIGSFCSPADMGLNAYNYGMTYASYEMTDVFLQIELAKHKNTPIIVELQHTDTGSLGDQSMFIPFVSDPRIRRLLTRFHALDWRYFVPGIRFFGYYDWILKNYLEARLGVSKTYQGYTEPVQLPPFDPAALHEAVEERLKISTGYFPNEDQNRRLIAHITQHPGRLFFLVVAPYHPSYYEHFQNEDKFEEYKAQLAGYTNVVVLDWGRMKYPADAFNDTLHLRQMYARDYSRKLGDKIREVLHQRNEQFPPEKAPSPTSAGRGT